MADEAATECLFERLRTHQQRSPESTEVARAITARINARLSSHDKFVRQSTLEKIWNKQSGALQMLLTILDVSKDFPTSTYIASILRETLCLKQGKGKKCADKIPGEANGIKKMKDVKKTGKENKSPVVKRASNPARQQCVENVISSNGTALVLRTLQSTFNRRDSNVATEMMLHDLVWILAAVAPKDPKFAIKVRIIGCVRTLHLIFKSHYTDNKMVFPMLVIMKQLAKNVGTTSILIRDGVICTYEKVLVSLGYIPTARLRLCLDAIDYFSRNKAGRRALCTKKHVQTLHRFCSQCPDEPEFDGLLARVCSVITLCLKHQALPVAATSPASFNLNPLIKGTNGTWLYNDDEDGGNSEKTANSDGEDDLPDLLMDGVDEFPDFDDESEHKTSLPNEPDKGMLKSSDSFQSSVLMNNADRDIDDLKRYHIFFKEFGSYNKQIKLVKSRSNSRGSILEDFTSFTTKNTPGGIHRSISTSMGNSYIDSDRRSSSSSLKMQESSSTTSCSYLKIYKDISKYTSFQSIYCSIASKVKSIVPFVKVAYPDMVGGQSQNQAEPLNKMERSACRNKLLACVDRAINPDTYMNEVVYDLDLLMSTSNVFSDTNPPKSAETVLTNSDEVDVIKCNCFAPRLSFESRFESGNLRKAIQIGPREYELILMPDVNSNKRHQWFYFEVRNMQQGRPYIFNIVNCEKSDSQFNFGMKPVMFSVKEAVLGRAGWRRVGTDICYYRNSYHYSNQKNNSKCYLTVTFNIEFPFSNDICYLAYHFPYTYSMMLARILHWSMELRTGTYFRVEPLCHSLNNNEVPLLTITAEDTPSNPIVDREIIFLTSRVHPGESNASWVMDGTLGCLLGNSVSASMLRSKFVIKVVPMLNVEGVINGCHRCGLTNEDLNRRWSKPNPVLHPSIYHSKGLIEYLVRLWKKPPFVYCDYHGHSRKKNVFFYGCASAESWSSNDRSTQDEPVKYLMLPALMHRISPAFALGSCSFRVERERESTARVSVWRHLGIARSYTMEASFCGFDRGPFKGFHLNTLHLQNVGSDFCEALNGLNDSPTNVDIQITKDLNSNITDIFLKGERNSEAEAEVPGSGSDSVLKTDSDEDFD